MSQKKVDAYKKEKANREQIIKKEKRVLKLEKLLAVVVGLVLVCWVGFSIYGKVTGGGAAVQKETVLDTTALDNYLNGLVADSAETAAE